MSAFERIRLFTPSLSGAEKKLARFLLSEKSKIPFLSIYEIAESTGVSTATISRLARKVGYKNFSAMKMDFVKGSQDSLQEIFHAIEPGDTDEAIIRKVFNGNIKSLKDTLNVTDTSTLSRFALVVSSARRILCFGIGGSGNVAADAALRFTHLDLQAEAYTDHYQILIQSLRSDPETVVIGVSHSGRSSIIIEGLKLARNKGAITCGISNYVGSTLSKFSDFFFVTSFPETKVKVAALSSRIAQLCLIDAIYLLVAKYKKRLWNTDRLNELTNRLLRYK